MTFALGSRVVTPGGSVGHVEAIDADTQYADVRCLTPDNVPSCVVSCCPIEQLRDGTNVMPQPRSREWLRQSALFCQGVERVLRQHID